MAKDRRDPVATAREVERRKALLAQLVDTRALTHGDHEVWSAVAENRLVRLSPQIYCPAKTWNGLRTYEQRLLLAAAAGRNAHTAVLVGRSAARLAGMWVVSLTMEKVEMATTGVGLGPSVRNNPRYKARHFALNQREVYAQDGLRATRLTRTAIDIARLHGFKEGLIAFDWLLRAGGTKEEIQKELTRMGRLKGIATARKCLHHATNLSESPFESLARALLIQAGHSPEPQFKVGRYRADLAIEQRVLIEIDGDGKYDTDTAAAVKKENDRKKRIENRGYRILRYRPTDLVNNPLSFVDEVEAALYTTKVS